MNDKRNIKREYVDSVLSDIDGKSIREAFEYIDKIIINYKEQRKELNYEYIRFYFERYYDSLEIHCERYETEREIRIREEDKQRQKEYKLKQYKQPKKELGL